MDTDNPVINITSLHRRYGQLDAVNGLNLRVKPRLLLRLFWPQRRRQDHHQQVPAQPAAPHEWLRARVWD